MLHEARLPSVANYIMTLEKIDTLPLFDHKPCYSSEHEPPAHIVLEPGTYRHTCPVCGKQTMFTVNFSGQLFHNPKNVDFYQELDQYR